MSAHTAQATADKPHKTSIGALLRIKLFVTGALFGALCLLIVVLMQWHSPDRLGWSIAWLPVQHLSDRRISALPSVIAIAPPKTFVVEVPVTLSVPAQTTDQSVPAPIALTSSIPMSMTAAPAYAQASALLIPVSGIKASQLTDTFKEARGNGRAHDAIDIMAPKDTPVLAVADGTLVKLFNSKQGGLTLYQFNVGETKAYYYAHLDHYADGMVEGMSLGRGEIIGFVGSTGNASPDAPHLHFAVFALGPEKKWWQGDAINPFPLLTGTR